MYADKIQFTNVEIQIITYLFKQFKNKFNARQIARSLNKNHSHVNKLCKSLVNKELLKKEDLQNSVYFSFNYEKSSVDFVKFLLKFEEFPKNLSSLLYKMKEFEELLHFGTIFGSSIKNKKFNDVDVLLVYEKKHKKNIQKIKTKIRKSKLIEQPIRYLELAPNDLDFNNEIIYDAFANSIVFCNANNYSEAIYNVTNKKSIEMVFKRRKKIKNNS